MSEVEKALAICRNIVETNKSTNSLTLDDFKQKIAERQNQKRATLQTKFEGKGLSIFGSATQLEELALETARRSGIQEPDLIFQSLSKQSGVQGSPLAVKKRMKYEELRKPAPKLNLNQASFAELLNIPGVGNLKAVAIIERRPFSKFEELLKISGIGPKALTKLSEFLTI